MAKTKLYSWARPLDGAKNLDHTWVTDFEIESGQFNPSDITEKSSKNYWYCWGNLHKNIRQRVSSASANLEKAKGISPPNIPALGFGAKSYSPSATSGAIVYYGLDGLCHQLANQILVTTGNETKEPIRVKDAKGYPLSTCFYGTYGLNTKVWQGILSKFAPNARMPGDDFLYFMEKHVSDEVKRKKLLSIRYQAQARIICLRNRVEKKTTDCNYYWIQRCIVVFALIKFRWLLGRKSFYGLFPSLNIMSTAWMVPPR